MSLVLLSIIPRCSSPNAVVNNIFIEIGLGQMTVDDILSNEFQI